MKADAFLAQPAAVYVLSDDGAAPQAATRTGDDWSTRDSSVHIQPAAPASPALAISVQCQRSISRVAVRWQSKPPVDALFLGDAWERGYGDLQWRTMQPERLMPWYFAAHSPGDRSTVAVGVKTGPAALCSWTVDPAGVTLWLDLRNGGGPVTPGDRTIPAASVVALDSLPEESPMAAIRRLCTQMCDKPRLASTPIAGNNNWYYAYGQNFDNQQVLRDATLVAELANNHPVKPYCVIDGGWSAGGVCPGGPWTAGRPDKFPNMPQLAQDILKLGVRPGIWIRPTALSFVDNPRRLRSGPQPAREKALDFTLPENLQAMADAMHLMHTWGYELIKHDFSTYDAFARWGFEMGAEITNAGWHWADRSLTNAEIILRVYGTLREAAGDSIIIGCNTMGHLAAGLFEIQRAGDDTSGKIWERTRKMGINTLAFRYPQHNTFFAVDADCVAHTDNTPWEKDRQFLDLVSRSGTALFVSTDPTKITPEIKTAMATALQRALNGGAAKPGGPAPTVEPLDWLATTCPAQWKIGGEKFSYDWFDPMGTWPLKL